MIHKLKEIRTNSTNELKEKLDSDDVDMNDVKQVVELFGDHENILNKILFDFLNIYSRKVVEECIAVSLKNSHRDDDMGAIIAKNIEQHFGIEE